MQRARDRLRELAARSRLLLPVEAATEEMKWGALLRYGHSTVRFSAMSHYALGRLALFVGKRRRRGRDFGLSEVAYLSPDRCGLVGLVGTVLEPRAGTAWRDRPNAGGERRR